MVIYKVTNNINGKVYIGQTVGSLNRRKIEHICVANNKCDYYFARALRKYGVDNFKWQVICICPNIDSLNEQEKYYITLYDSMRSGYNCTSGGLNFRLSTETKKKISEGQSGDKGYWFGKKMSMETRKKISIALIGHGVREETRRKIRESHKNNGIRPLSRLGKKHTKETKEKISKAGIGRKASDETKLKMSIANSGKNNYAYGKCGKDSLSYGRKHTKETKNKIRIAALKQWEKIREKNEQIL